MFGAKKVSEPERLRAFYADQTDGELLQLDSNRDGLTNVAGEALAEIMTQRGLTQTEADEASGAHEEMPEVPAELGSREVFLYLGEALLDRFRDMFHLRKTIRALEEAEIGFRVVDRSRRDRTGWNGNEIATDLIVRETDVERAATLLREARRLSPEASDSSESRSSQGAADELSLLHSCERSEALRLVQELSGAGVSFLWRDGRADTELPDENTIAIEVYESQQERANDALQRWMSASEHEGTVRL